MRKAGLLFSVLLGLSVITSCANSSKTKDHISDSSGYKNELAADSATEPRDYKASRTIYTDLITTKLELRPEWENAYLKGRATITAKPHFYPSDSLILDAKGMTINSVAIDGKLLQYTYKEDVLKIKLDKTYIRNESYIIQIDYIAKPNERVTSGSSAIKSDKGLYFINPANQKDGFMPQIWTQGETEANSVWFPTIDSPNSKSAQEISLIVADKYKTLSNGKLVSSTKNTDGTRTDVWKQDLKHPVYLFMIAIGEFEVIEDTFTRKDGSRMAVNYYVEPEWKGQAKAIFGKTPQMIRFFSDLLGVEYPWDKYHQIVVREYVSGAMENTGAVVFGDFVYRNDRELADKNDESIVAHELFHHWFGDLVTCESWSNLPLNESFANYSQYLWDEHAYGKDVAQYNMEEEIMGYYNAGTHHNMIWFDYNDKEDMFDAHSYNKGGAILHQLRAYLGDEAFFTGLNNYLTKHAYKTAEIHDLRLAFEEICGEDLNWYFNQWFLDKGHPETEASFSYNYEKTKFNLTFVQQQPDNFPTYTIPMVVTYIDDAGTHTEKFKITQRNQTVSFGIKGKLQTIIIDPEKTLLGNYVFKSTPDFWLKQFEAATNYLTKKEAIHGYMTAVNDKAKLKAFTTAVLNDTFFGTQITVLDELINRTGTADLAEITDIQKIKSLTTIGKQYEVRSKAIDLYMSSAASKEEKIKLLDLIADKELSYNVLSKVLEHYIELNPDRANELIETFSKKHSSSEIDFQIAGYYLQQRVPGKIDFYQNLYKKAPLRDKGNALIYLGYYSFSSSIQDMKNFIGTVDSVYSDLGYFKPYVSGMIVEATAELKKQDEILTKKSKEAKANPDLAIVLKQLQETRVLYEAFLKKHSIKAE
ncbi:MAG: hypothetical protein BGO87_11880 [Flavobacteriia bacterium 40-80]|nr:MAG: hypothetical protein BGO87_11880 [Flavobacteriia bacterium 40-80]